MVTSLRSGGHHGFTLVEMMWALVLLALVTQAAWTVLGRHRVAADHVTMQAEGLETVRTVAWLLSEELAGGRQGEDWELFGEDSLRLRAFRGVGLVRQDLSRDGRTTFCYQGIRNPNPEKDSVMVLERSGAWQVVGLESRDRRDEPCQGIGGGWLEDWVMVPEPAGPVLGKLFERGSYHLSGGALRYRRGEGGRQPMTAPRILRGTFGSGGKGKPALQWNLALSWGASRADSLAWRGGAR